MSLPLKDVSVGSSTVVDAVEANKARNLLVLQNQGDDIVRVLRSRGITTSQYLEIFPQTIAVIRGKIAQYSHLLLAASGTQTVSVLEGFGQEVPNSIEFVQVYGTRSDIYVASAARTASVAFSARTNAHYSKANWVIDVTAVSGTTPTLSINYQVDSPSGFTTVASTPNITTVSTNYFMVGAGVTGAVFGSATIGSTAFGAAVPFNRNYRLQAIIGGTTPSFTFSITEERLP